MGTLAVQKLSLCNQLLGILCALSRAAGDTTHCNLQDAQAKLPEIKLRPTGGYNVTRRLGESFFAKPEAYFESRAKRPYISDQGRADYFRQGYLMLPGLVPPDTVVALRKELLRTHPADGYSTNAWMESDSLLDFLCFGPLGNVAAELFQSASLKSGSVNAHLLRSTHNFEWGAGGRWHYDWAECEDGFPPAHDTKRAHVKFYVSLYDDMPGMWLVNQSAFEAMLARTRPGGSQLRSAFRVGQLHPPQGLCDDDPVLPCESSKVPKLDATELEHASIKPLLKAGDVIVHATTVVHRPPQLSEPTRRGFVTAAYGQPTTQYSGMHDVIAGHHRLCDSGVPLYRARRHIPDIAHIPRPNCFPRAGISPQTGNHLTKDMELVLRRGSLVDPGRRQELNRKAIERLRSHGGVFFE